MTHGRAWLVQADGYRQLVFCATPVALICGSLSALIPGLFLSPKGFTAFTPSPRQPVSSLGPSITWACPSVLGQWPLTQSLGCLWPSSPLGKGPQSSHRPPKILFPQHRPLGLGQSWVGYWWEGRATVSRTDRESQLAAGLLLRPGELGR